MRIRGLGSLGEHGGSTAGYSGDVFGMFVVETEDRDILNLQKLGKGNLGWNLHGWVDKLELLKDQLVFSFEL